MVTDMNFYRKQNKRKRIQSPLKLEMPINIKGWKSPLGNYRLIVFKFADAQADLSLRWAQRSFCWFCHEAAQIGIVINVYTA